MENRSKGINKKKVANSDNKGSRSEAHRVLVLQGGGALGAYEAGVFDVCITGSKRTKISQIL